MNEIENKKEGLIRDIMGCLVSPRSSFKSLLEKPSLKKSTALVLVIAIIAAWASFNYAGKLPRTSLFPGREPPVNPEQLHQMWMITSAIMALIGIFGTWLISSVLIHLISRPLGGKGTFRSMLTLAGYASAPLLIQQILRLADSFMISREALQLATSLQMSAIAEAAVDIFTIFGIWSMILLIIATRENYKMSTARSIVATALSFILIVFISTFLPLR